MLAALSKAKSLFNRPPRAPDQHVIPGDPVVTVQVRRSTRARRMTLRVSRVDGRATLTLPARLPWPEALAFVESRAAWLRGHVTVAVTSDLPLTCLPVRGVNMPLSFAPVRRMLVGPEGLILPQGAHPGPRLIAWLRAQARDDLSAACDRHAAALGRPYGRLTLRDTRSRWGSCSARGDLMFNWRLIMAPPAVLDYVAAHEVAHLARMDHSPAFWAVVARLFPDHAAARAWLRAHGDALQRVRLDG